eukprot:2461885-Pyramimonas_sp.AAC.1
MRDSMRIIVRGVPPPASWIMGMHTERILTGCRVVQYLHLGPPQSECHGGTPVRKILSVGDSPRCCGCARCT